MPRPVTSCPACEPNSGSSSRAYQAMPTRVESRHCYAIKFNFGHSPARQCSGGATTAGSLGEPCHRCDTAGRFRTGLRHAQLMRQGGWESQFEPGTQSSTIRQRHEHSSQREVNTMQQHVSPIGRWNLSPRRGRSRIAARFQMGCDCGRLAGSDVGKCSRPCNSGISCVRRLPFKQEQVGPPMLSGHI